MFETFLPNQMENEKRCKNLLLIKEELKDEKTIEITQQRDNILPDTFGLLMDTKQKT